MSRRTRLSAVLLLTSILALVLAGSALGEQSSAAGDGPEAAAKPSKGGKGGKGGSPGSATSSKTAVRLQGLSGGKLKVGKSVKVRGTLRPFRPKQKVIVLVRRGKKTIKRKKLRVQPKKGSSSLGQFKLAKRLIKPGRYSVQVIHKKNPVLGASKDSTRAFHLRFPDLGKGASGDVVKLFNNLLAKQGYVNDRGSSYDSATERAVLAYHKVNNESLNERGSSGMFKKLAKGKGGFKVKHPGAGKHVETDLSRQVMVLAEGGRAAEIYTISSGKSTTPTIIGKFRFYRKDPGYNSIGMYYSAYFLRGYATHGYESVPDYPASHGCLRNPIPDSKHIYDWINLGDPIYVYR